MGPLGYAGIYTYDPNVMSLDLTQATGRPWLDGRPISNSANYHSLAPALPLVGKLPPQLLAALLAVVLVIEAAQAGGRIYWELEGLFKPATKKVHGNNLTSNNEGYVYAILDPLGAVLKYGIGTAGDGFYRPISQFPRIVAKGYSPANVSILFITDNRITARAIEAGLNLQYMSMNAGNLPPASDVK
ncbi:MAG: hypothetical protein J0M35_21220 [Candidatus Obscuribacter phosphatis]|uniref:Uncharacterized protein n=1 Tax=Candidatus Obscuribacter phosphatis TaxID=1906157 RepID=A0A8J7TPA3_9BACT|nr:hypothetical protein [Candidatus Obscuribacter phosphatis]